MKRFIVSIVGTLILLSYPLQVETKTKTPVYSVLQYEKELMDLKKRYHLNLMSIGHSEKGKDIWAVKLGKGKKSILINGSHHGREWLSTLLIMKMIKAYAKAYEYNVTIDGYPTNILDEVSLIFVPMVNPDGVQIQQGDLSAFDLKEKWALFRMNNFSTNWSRWKANAKGIDLNRQYPAGWNEVDTNTQTPQYQFYKGKKPLEASETKALYLFTKQIKPILAVSYHTSGREIFWYYHNKPENILRDYNLVKKVTAQTGYKLSIPKENANGSGYTDWFINEFERPAMTIELSHLVDETSPPIDVIYEEWNRNRSVLLMLASEAYSTL
ncbi:M14 family zinc carboxypeptidase [Bacillus cihuensis]|uniref:M14 family zinc carboxypeptidase n=1 Tax=Bacillus cihuensis TaxID=1208599 RepID=UPI0004143C8D|nr:M14 family zinc carboxypeptidase [Bacillus cihuensis]